MATWLMRGLSTLIRLSACTTSGQFLAGEGEIGLEGIVALQIPDLLDEILRGLGRMAAHLQQGQHQRGELMPHGQAGETDADVRADAADHEGRGAPVVIRADEGDLVRGEGGDLFEQVLQLDGLGGVVEEGHQLDRVDDVGQEWLFSCA